MTIISKTKFLSYIFEMQLKELSYLSDNSFMRCFDKAGAFNKVSRHSKLSQVFHRCSSSNKSSFNVSKKKILYEARSHRLV